MKNKGFTIIELLLTISLVSVVLIVMFQVIFLIKNLYVNSGIRVNLLQKQLIIAETLNNDFSYKTLVMARKSATNEIEFTFSDGTIKTLEYNRTNKTLKYGDFSTKLIGQSIFGNISIYSEKTYDNSSIVNDSILVINIPIYNELFLGENFGTKIIYQYNSAITSIDSINLDDNIEEDKKIFLIGGSNYTIYTTIPYTDPGYYLKSESGELIENDPNVVVSGYVGTTAGIYQVTYTYSDSFGNIVDTITRNINVINAVANFSATNSCYEYTVPTTGMYKLEVWGAQGGSANQYDIGGKGGYTVGYQYFNKNTKLFVCVGTQGGINLTGGFNGGGESVYGTSGTGGSGGGATDIRTSSSFNDTIIVAGGGGGSGSKNDSASPSVGGYGGGGSGSFETASYNGKGGTETTAGEASTFLTSITKFPTSGTKLIGGTSGLYSNTYSGGAGGGGYFGGGGGVRYGAGGGGSSYCGNTLSCIIYTGEQTFKSPTNENVIGKSENGYARITIVSIGN